MARVWPFDFEAFEAKCRELGFLDYQKWWYASLLARAYFNEERPGYLRNVTGDLYKQAGVTATLPLRGHLLREWSAVLARFVVTDDGWITHPRVVKESERAKVLSLTRSNANKCRTNVKSRDIEVSISSDFAFSIYQDYPRKAGKKKALPAIRKAIREIQKEHGLNEIDAAQKLHEAVIEYAKARKGKPKQYTPYPASWMNAGRYDDDRESWYDETDGKPQGLANQDGSTYQRRLAEVFGGAVGDDLGGMAEREG